GGHRSGRGDLGRRVLQERGRGPHRARAGGPRPGRRGAPPRPGARPRGRGGAV
ncbi:MAG: hypothetical protein AVDCRST_MAG03-2353, partial [uncultured Rubrobacteraceae bacterium]